MPRTNVLPPKKAEPRIHPSAPYTTVMDPADIDFYPSISHPLTTNPTTGHEDPGLSHPASYPHFQTPTPDMPYERVFERSAQSTPRHAAPDATAPYSEENTDVLAPAPAYPQPGPTPDPVTTSRRFCETITVLLGDPNLNTFLAEFGVLSKRPDTELSELLHDALRSDESPSFNLPGGSDMGMGGQGSGGSLS